MGMHMPVSPPRPAGPPLNALRAFEAAARHGSFSGAAGELCVTAGAVAQHVKTLEAWAGASLFQRRAQGVELTALGKAVLPGFVSAFNQLSQAVQTLRAQAKPHHIRIAALPSIAQLWLSPRLPEIRAAARDVTISITALEAPPNLQREQFDMCVFIEHEPDHPQVIEICDDVIFPVCAPALAAQLSAPEDLTEAVCLQDATWSDDWTQWMESASPGTRLQARGPVFSLYSLAVEEAKNGAGIVMGHEPLVRAQLDAGTLVAPFTHRLTLRSKLVVGTAQSLEAGSVHEAIVDLLIRQKA